MALEISSPAVSSLFTETLDLPPSCIQFSPAHPTYFVIGTYNLQKDEEPISESQDEDVEAAKKPQSRNGSLLVYALQGDRPQLIQTIHQPSAILDLRFHPGEGNEGILAVVSSTGTLAVFQLEPTQDTKTPLKHLTTSRCEDLGKDTLFLQCNWHTTHEKMIGVTASNGIARLLELDDAWAIRDSFDMNIANSLEAWAIAFASPSKTQAHGEHMITAYCGGDDSVLRYTTISLGGVEGELACQEPYGATTVAKRHDAGVTAILPLPCFSKSGQRLVLTGSYDDCIRGFLIQDLDTSFGAKVVQPLLEENLGGGVWRLDLIDIRLSQEEDTTKIRVLASCMHAGVRLAELEWCEKDNPSLKLRVLGRFEEHESMNYGSDFVRPGMGDHGRLRCVSTSFYDKRLCMWECKL